jgi:arylsulfatase
MLEHDGHVGQLLDKLDELGITDNTVVFYSTDNGPHYNTWPDAAATPFRGEKNTNWEGGWRVPAMVRWPGKVPAASVSNGIMHHMDWLPTVAAIAGDTDIKDKLLKGERIGNKSFKVHLDGYNQLDMLLGNGPSQRAEVFYFSDDGDLISLRYNDWKAVFAEQRVEGTLQVWAEPFVKLRIPKLFNLRRDPYERADITSNTYYDWYIDRAFTLYGSQAIVARFLATFKEFPPRQKPASFTIDQILEELQTPTNN